MLRRHALAIAVLAASAVPLSCTRSGEPRITVEPRTATPPARSTIAEAPSVAAPPVSAAPPVAPRATAPSAWTDPAVVASLASDCGWTPPKSDAESTSDSRRGALSCEFLVEQSCVPDPCLTEQEEKCKPVCAKTCASCGTRCAVACTTCKSPCRDDACRLRCATTCGQCRQGCVADADRCATGTCGAAHARCATEKNALFKKHAAACKKVCAAAADCPGRCSAEPEEKQAACWTACKTRFVAGGCPEIFYGTCMMAGSLEGG